MGFFFKKPFLLNSFVILTCLFFQVQVEIKHQVLHYFHRNIFNINIYRIFKLWK